MALRAMKVAIQRNARSLFSFTLAKQYARSQSVIVLADVQSKEVAHSHMMKYQVELPNATPDMPRLQVPQEYAQLANAYVALPLVLRWQHLLLQESNDQLHKFAAEANEQMMANVNQLTDKLLKLHVEKHSLKADLTISSLQLNKFLVRPMFGKPPPNTAGCCSISLL